MAIAHSPRPIRIARRGRKPSINFIRSVLNMTPFNPAFDLKQASCQNPKGQQKPLSEQNLHPVARGGAAAADRSCHAFRKECLPLSCILQDLDSATLLTSLSPKQGKPDQPGSERSRRESQAKVLALAIERAGVDAEDSRGCFARFGVFEDEPDMLGFKLLERDRSAQAHRGRRFFLSRGQVRADSAWKIAEFDLAVRGEEDCPLDRVAQLAQVARPRVARNCGPGRGRETV